MYTCVIQQKNKKFNKKTGRPKLTDYKLLPLFPPTGTKLPNEVRPDLTIVLGPLTRKQVYSAYMEIERPPEVLPHFESIGIPSVDGKNKKELIENKFFSGIAEGELKLRLPGTFSADTMKQLTSDQLYREHPVNLQALNISDSDEKTGDIRKRNTIGEFY